jgi:hypothetical protein
LGVPSKPLTPKQPEPSQAEGQQAQPQTKLIDRSSKEPEDRRSFLRWLGAMSVAFRAPQSIVMARVWEVARSALKDGVSWQDVYEVAKSAQLSPYPEPPGLDFVNPGIAPRIVAR